MIDILNYSTNGLKMQREGAGRGDKDTAGEREEGEDRAIYQMVNGTRQILSKWRGGRTGGEKPEVAEVRGGGVRW